MFVEKIPNLLMLNEEKVMESLLANGEDRAEMNMWLLYNEASNHMTKDKAKFKKLDEKLIENVKFGNVKFGKGSIVPIQGKESTLF